MRNIFSITVCTAAMTAIFCGCTSQQTAKPVKNTTALGSSERLMISIEQNGRVVPISDHTAFLEKAPFTVVLSFPASETPKVMLNASRSDKLANAVATGQRAGAQVPLKRQALKEPLFNPEQKIYLTPDAYNYWYYLSEKIHRFDRVDVADGRIVCRRTVTRYADGPNQPVKRISTLQADTLYWVFVKESLERLSKRRTEQYAEYLKMKFE